MKIIHNGKEQELYGDFTIPSLVSLIKSMANAGVPIENRSTILRYDQKEKTRIELLFLDQNFHPLIGYITLVNQTEIDEQNKKIQRRQEAKELSKEMSNLFKKIKSLPLVSPQGEYSNNLDSIAGAFLNFKEQVENFMEHLKEVQEEK